MDLEEREQKLNEWENRLIQWENRFIQWENRLIQWENRLIQWENELNEKEKKYKLALAYKNCNVRYILQNENFDIDEQQIKSLTHLFH